jgi:hypothetical protein
MNDKIIDTPNHMHDEHTPDEANDIAAASYIYVLRDRYGTSPDREKEALEILFESYGVNPEDYENKNYYFMRRGGEIEVIMGANETFIIYGDKLPDPVLNNLPKEAVTYKPEHKATFIDVSMIVATDKFRNFLDQVGGSIKEYTPPDPFGDLTPDHFPHCSPSNKCRDA